MNYYHYYESPVGKLVIVHNDQGLKYLDLADRLEVKEGVFQPTELIQQTISQLTQYFNGTRQEFESSFSANRYHISATSLGKSSNDTFW